MGHHLKGKDFLSDKYRILRIDDLEKLKKTHWDIDQYTEDKHPLIYREQGYNLALEDIKKSSEATSLNKIVLSFRDEEARQALKWFANLTKDKKLRDDILEVLDNYKE